MRNLSSRTILWCLKRYTKNENLWDRVCFSCKQVTPVFEYEHHDKQEQLLFGYLCESCAQKKLAEWLQCEDSLDYRQFSHITDFDIVTVFYEQKNDGETLQLTRWSPEQRRRRLQGEDE